MKRVEEDKNWTLFSPGEAPELHDLIGKDFENKYEEYEEKAKNGEMDQFKSIPAKELWRKMLTMLFETGHPWITFKDSCNLRSPQQHAGVIHSSNLCTEITLNTSADSEIAHPMEQLWQQAQEFSQEFLFMKQWVYPLEWARI